MKIVFELQDDGLTQDEIEFAKKTMSDLHILLSNLHIHGLSIEVLRESLKPPAMGHIQTVVRVWRR